MPVTDVAGLMNRFVSTSVGFAYLHKARYIDQEMDSWVSVCPDRMLRTD
jgi:hypothetical protein